MHPSRGVRASTRTPGHTRKQAMGRMCEGGCRPGLWRRRNEPERSCVRFDLHSETEQPALTLGSSGCTLFLPPSTHSTVKIRNVRCANDASSLSSCCAAAAGSTNRSTRKSAIHPVTTCSFNNIHHQSILSASRWRPCPRVGVRLSLHTYEKDVACLFEKLPFPFNCVSPP